MPLHCAATDYRLAELTSDATKRDGAVSDLRGFGVTAPERFIEMLVPGVRSGGG
jgi:hypothetical protein